MRRSDVGDHSCLPYTWEVTGKTYNKSGDKYYKSTTSEGCPIRDTLTLTITKGHSNVVEATSCLPYYWDVTGRTYNKSGLKTFKSSQPDADGCYTYDTLDLVVLNCDKNPGTTIQNSQFKIHNLTIYPNPTTGRVQIDAAQVERVEVIDLVGRRVALFEKTANLDLSSLADGTYTLRITTPDGVAIRKVVKR